VIEYDGTSHGHWCFERHTQYNIKYVSNTVEATYVFMITFRNFKYLTLKSNWLYRYVYVNIKFQILVHLYNNNVLWHNVHFTQTYKQTIPLLMVKCINYTCMCCNSYLLIICFIIIQGVNTKENIRVRGFVIDYRY